MCVPYTNNNTLEVRTACLQLKIKNQMETFVQIIIKNITLKFSKTHVFLLGHFLLNIKFNKYYRELGFLHNIFNNNKNNYENKI